MVMIIIILKFDLIIKLKFFLAKLHSCAGGQLRGLLICVFLANDLVTCQS